jgi:hypothetical protein
MSSMVWFPALLALLGASGWWWRGARVSDAPMGEALAIAAPHFPASLRQLLDSSPTQIHRSDITLLIEGAVNEIPLYAILLTVRTLKPTSALNLL